MVLYSGLGGYVTLIYKYFSNSGSRNILIREVNYWHKKTEDLESVIKEKDEEIESLNVFITNLKLQIIENQVELNNLPLPIAILNDQAQMVEFNHKYSELFLKPAGKNPFNYYSKTSMEFWGNEIGKSYTKTDLEILASGESWLGTEQLMQSDGIDLLSNYLIHKSVFWKNRKRFLIFTALKLNKTQNIIINE